MLLILEEYWKSLLKGSRIEQSLLSTWLCVHSYVCKGDQESNIKEEYKRNNKGSPSSTKWNSSFFFYWPTQRRKIAVPFGDTFDNLKQYAWNYLWNIKDSLKKKAFYSASCQSHLIQWLNKFEIMAFRNNLSDLR